MNTPFSSKSVSERVFDCVEILQNNPSFINKFSPKMKDLLIHATEAATGRTLKPFSISTQKEEEEEGIIFMSDPNVVEYILSEEEILEMERVMSGVGSSYFDITKYNLEMFRLMRSGIFRPRACL